MPSVSTKQAHLMSAVAHGWKPTGSAAGLPVSVAKKFHAADAGHKYGAGMHGGKGRPYPKHNYEYGGAIAIARKYSPRRRYADGGGDGDYVSPTGYDLPPEITRGRSQSRPPDPDFDSAWRRRVTLPMALAPQSDDSDDLRQQLMQEGMRRRGFQDGGGADDDFDTRWQDENWQLMPQQYGDRQYKPILDATLANRATQYPQYTPPPKGKEFNIPTKAEFEALLRRQGYDIGGGTPSPDMDDPSVPRMLRPGTSFNQRWPDRDLPVQASFDDRFGSPSFSQRWNDRTLPAQAAGVIPNPALRRGLTQDRSPASFGDRFDAVGPMLNRYNQQQIKKNMQPGMQDGGEVRQLSPGAQSLLDQHGSPEAAIQGGIQKLQQAYRSETPYWSGVLNELRGLRGGGFADGGRDDDDPPKVITIPPPAPIAPLSPFEWYNVSAGQGKIVPPLKHWGLKERQRGGRHYQFGGGYKFKSNFNPERAAAFGLSKQSGMLHSSVPGRTDKLNLNVPSGSYIIPADVTSGMGQGNSMAGAKILDNMFNKGPYGMNIQRMHAGSPRVGGMRMSSMSKMSMPGGAGKFGQSAGMGGLGSKNMGGFAFGGSALSRVRGEAQGLNSRDQNIIDPYRPTPDPETWASDYQTRDRMPVYEYPPKAPVETGMAPGGVPPTGRTAPIVAAGGEYVVHPDHVRRIGGGDIDTGHDILDRFVKLQRQKHIKDLKGLKPPKGSDEAMGKK